MASVGLLPALALLGGAALGATGLLPDLPWWLPGAWGVVALVAWRAWCPRLSVVAIVLGFVSVALMLEDAARARALHTSVRAWLDARYGGVAIETLGPPGAHGALPLRCRLTEDASDHGEVIAIRATVQAIAFDGEWHAVTGGVLLSVAGIAGRSRLTEWRAGRTIVAPVTFRRPSRYLNDGLADFERDLALSGISLLGSVKSGLLIDVVARGHWLEEWSGAMRARVRRAVARTIAAPRGAAGARSAAVVTAVLIGDRSGLPRDERTRLQAAGTYHVIAISGGNIALLVLALVVLLAGVGLRGRRASALVLVALAGYACLVVAGPSVRRATWMAAAYLAAKLIDQRAPIWQAVALSAGAIVVADPLDLRDAGFVMTFGATLALMEGGRRLVAWRGQRFAATTAPAIGWVAEWVIASLAASIAVEAALVPVSALMFSRVTGAGLVLNLLALPLMALVQMGGMWLVLLDGVHGLSTPGGWIAHHAATALLESARLVDVAPWLARRVPPPPVWMVVVYYTGLAGLLCRRTALRRVGGLALLAALICMVRGLDPAAARQWPSAGALRLTMIDVGQGDALLAQTAAGESLLIDTGGAPFGGGAFDIGERVLAPALWARGVRTLGALLITHGDPDHIGGAAAIVDDFSPSRLWLGVPVPSQIAERDLRARAAERGIPIERLRRGQRRSWGAGHIRVLHPRAPEWERQRPRNDDSVVVEIVYGDVAIVLTGDVSADVEREMVTQLTPARVRVLKVAHHGSRTSSSLALLEGWRPQFAIISCGRGNRFGHPTPEVLARFESIGASVYRTDRDGEITLETDGKSIQVRTFVQSRSAQK